MQEQQKHTIIYATGSRADYGIVRKYLKFLNEDKNIQLSLLVTGTHLSPKHGYSIQEIEADGYTIVKTIPLDLQKLEQEDVTDAMAKVIKESGAFFATSKCSLLIVLGDRYEIFGVAAAAAINGIPILHLHGGEKTLGNYDEFLRHSITKMSTFHFTSTEEYRRRVIQMGENPSFVFNMGAMGTENCLLYDSSRVIDEIKKLHNERYLVVVFHPETASGCDAFQQLCELTNALVQVPEDYKIVIIGSNADTGADKIHDGLLSFQKKRECYFFQNLQADSYLDLIAHAQAIIGNSSSGIIEAPTLGTYTINIGKRQEGRVRASSVIDVSCKSEDILQAILFVCGRREQGEKIENPYYQKDVARRCYIKTKELIAQLPLTAKNFYDLR